MSTRKACVVTPTKEGGKAISIVDILVMIGSALGIISAIFDILGFGFAGWGVFVGRFFLGYIWVLVWAIIDIILCAALIAGLGYLPNFPYKINDLNWVWLLILGIVIIAPTGNYGGGVIIAAAIVKIFC